MSLVCLIVVSTTVLNLGYLTVSDRCKYFATARAIVFIYLTVQVARATACSGGASL